MTGQGTISGCWYYSSTAWFARVMQAGALPAVRANPIHPQPKHFDHTAYRRRHKVETMSAKLKEWRALATRCDTTLTSFKGTLCLATAFQWLS